MTIEEKIAVLKAHRKAINEATSFESYKSQQLAYIDFLIEDFEAEIASEDRVLSWIAKVTTNV